ncbi:MAG: FAD binding domain-containing protein [Candidatus Hodarchaeales archaeon]
MVINVKEYHVPVDIKQAIELLARDEPVTRVLAGGTSLVRMKNPSVEALVDLRKLNLSYVKENDDTLIIGATTTVTEMLESPLVEKWGRGILKKACNVIADTPLRNLITLGGNIIKLNYWYDLPIILLALDAKINVFGKEGKRTFDAEEFFAQQPGKILEKSEIITDVVFPASDGYGSFHKFSKTKVDYAIFDAAVYIEKDGNKWKKVRITISGCVKLPQRWKTCEEKLKGIEINEEVISNAVNGTVDQIVFRKSYKASIEYRKHVLVHYVKDMLLKILEV